MGRPLRIFALFAALPFILAGCDPIDLLGQFHFDAPLSLTLEKNIVPWGGSIALYPGGGTPPFSFSLIERKLVVSGGLGSVSGQMYTAGAGTGIGEIIIRLTDAHEDSAYSMVTVVPPTPASFTVVRNAVTSANDIDLSWSYGDTSQISGFRIERSLDGVTFTNPVSLPSSATSYTDTGLNKNLTYSYRVYAIAGPYDSLPTPVLGSTP